MEKSKGQIVFEALSAWIGSFVVMGPAERIVITLWVMHTWFSARWPVTPYLHVTSEGPGCGKTTLLEVVQPLCCQARLRATLRPLAVVRDIQENQAALPTYLFDQVEALTSTKMSDERAILLQGYRKGGEHGIAVGARQVAFSVYCPKAFASIGDVAGDLRSRVLLLMLRFGAPSRDWSEAMMTRDTEARVLVSGMVAMWQAAGYREAAPAWVMPDWMTGREREIFAPLWSVACALELDAETIKAVRFAFTDFTEGKKTSESRSYRELVNVVKDERAEYAKRALRDLAAVLPVGDKVHTGNVFSAVAVERMKALDGPWRVFQGRGLDVDTLASLVSGYGVKSEVLGERKGRAAKKLNGYHGRKVREALAKLSGDK
jgi:hypothetical protein